MPAWLRHAGQCELGRDWVKDSSLLYYPDNETLRCECGEETHIVCTIEVKIFDCLREISQDFFVIHSIKESVIVLLSEQSGQTSIS